MPRLWNGTQDAGVPQGYLKCFMSSASYGIWLQGEHVRSRKDLAAAMNKFYDPSVKICKDGRGLQVIFIDREQVYHLFDDSRDAQPGIEPEKNWAQVSQRAAQVLVS
jgi:hypothetical protein